MQGMRTVPCWRNCFEKLGNILLAENDLIRFPAECSGNKLSDIALNFFPFAIRSVDGLLT